ncbi:LOW QUALITY PROTEIN: cation/H(+) antiporter 20-like [Prosopis cineraria]|uniref:LOW QUALITY PROTEIN: cation/H(+) antiporter 20-like n=1 Tax=Prosopis cineraria TaxID=364024 RepID=UPI0024107ABC|nr:LOW QUALITY PROTEIN: cation/H(+) antiporter 20-like [Prosopis cineraria]
MTVNMTTIKTSSDGAWQGDNPLNYAFPLLIVQTTLVLSVSRFFTFLLKPLRQPKVVAEILGGILLGPSAIGRNKDFMHLVFPSWSTPILESVASIGLLFFLFLVGLELDLRCIRRSGKQALSIAVAGIFLPFLFGVGVTFLLQKVIHFNGYIQHLMFMGVSLSITAFPVLARILAELKLLTTQVGETAMAAAAFNDVAAWILLALAVALAGGGHKSPLISIWVLISGAAFVIFMLLIVRPMMGWVARQCSREHDVLDEACICLTLGGVLLSGFMTDLIGIHSIFGGFVFGLTIPKGGEFAGRLTKRIEDFVSSLLLPLYFASSGLKTDVGKMKTVEAWGLLSVIILTASAGKIFGTFLVCMMCMIPARESLALGVLMNTKGLVELIVLNIGKEKKVLNDEMFTILVLMALFTTFMTTPTVMAIYKPARAVASQISHRHKARQLPPLSDMQEDLRILACIHGPGNIPSLINFIETIRATSRSQLKLYVMHLVELTDRSSSILMVQRTRKNGFPLINRFRRGPMHDQIASAFQAHGQVGQITVHHLTAVSALSTMHEDICHIAKAKRIAFVILPFHMRWRGDDEDAIENIGQGWREVNQRVLQYSPCPVSVLVHRCGLRCRPEQATQAGTTGAVKRVCIVFTGGPDGRKALELGSRMLEHLLIRLIVVRFVGDHRSKASNSIAETEKELDDAAMADFRAKWHERVEVIQKNESNMTEEVLAIGKGMEYELLIVGKSQQCVGSTMEAKLEDSQMEHAELGPIGGLLSSVDQGITCSVLVVQDQDFADSNETTFKKVDRERRSVITEAITTIESSV